MMVNLATPYQPKPSSPRTEGIAFYAPDCDDFLFEARHANPAIVCLPHQRSLSLSWELTHNLVRSPLRTGTVEPRFDNSFAIPLPLADLAPGFYDLRVRLQLMAGVELPAQTTFGWRIAEAECRPEVPADFAAFWREARLTLDALTGEPECRLERVLRGSEIDDYNRQQAALPDNYDPSGRKVSAVEMHRVRFAGPLGRDVHGWFTRPVGGESLPAVLVLPGAGNNARPAPVEHAAHGYAALDIQVHGNSVDAPAYDAIPPDVAPDPRERTHFAIYLRACLAARLLARFPGVDPQRRAVLGGSQGGRLSLVVAALEPEIRAAIPGIAHYAYLPWLRWTERMNELQSSGEGGFLAAEPIPARNASDAYFDVLNFAPLIRCPVLMNAGLTDPISSPTGIYAVFRELHCPKEILALPNTGHDWAPAFDRYAWRWLAEKLSP